MKYPDSTSYYNQIEFEGDLKKYLSLPPYNTPTNPVAYDGHYLQCLYNKYGEDVVERAINQMQNN